MGQRTGPNTTIWRERLREATKKLTDGQVTEIRDLLASGVKGYQIADMYGVCHSTISNIKHGKHYKEVI